MKSGEAMHRFPALSLSTFFAPTLGDGQPECDASTSIALNRGEWQLGSICRCG
jgi:hypothetical protein